MGGSRARGHSLLATGHRQRLARRFHQDGRSPPIHERFAYFPGGLTLKRMDEWGTSLIGSPETVIKKARLMIETARPDSQVGMFSFGGLSHEQVMRSIELFATKVMPALGD